jgi:hypothetical protein
VGLFDSFGDLFNPISWVKDAFDLGQDIGHAFFPSDSAGGAVNGLPAAFTHLAGSLDTIQATLRRQEDRDLAMQPQSSKPARTPQAPLSVFPMRDSSPVRTPAPLQANPDYQPRQAPVAEDRSPLDLLPGLSEFMRVDPMETRRWSQGADAWLRRNLPFGEQLFDPMEPLPRVTPQQLLPQAGPGQVQTPGFTTGGGFGGDLQGSDEGLDPSVTGPGEQRVGPGAGPLAGPGGGAGQGSGAAAAATGTGGRGGSGGAGGSSSSSSAPSVSVQVTVNNSARGSATARSRSPTVSRMGNRKMNAAGGATRAARRTTKARTQPRNAAKPRSGNRRAPTPAQQAARERFAAASRAGTLRRKRR